MLIRSQDRKSIINIDRVSTINVGYDRYINCFYSGDVEDFETIAEYKTEEKAVKVLDMIQKTYMHCELFKAQGNSLREPAFVFQMPQDDEVEV